MHILDILKLRDSYTLLVDLAFFNGDIEVVGNNTAYLPNVESNNILSNTIDTTNAYVSEKLFRIFTR